MTEEERLAELVIRGEERTIEALHAQGMTDKDIARWMNKGNEYPEGIKK